jgi:hypothetical protein
VTFCAPGCSIEQDPILPGDLMNRQILALLPASCMAAVFFMAAEANSPQPPAPSAVDPAPYGQDATPDPDGGTVSCGQRPAAREKSLDQR